MGNAVHELTELLRELPGIGPRQARRLALWFLRKDTAWVEKLAKTLVTARTSARSCSLCMRYFEPKHNKVLRCDVCSDDARDTSLLLVVEREVDAENIERTGTYKGRYFVLGGTASLVDADPERRIKLKELLKRIQDPQEPIQEIILALSATTEGEDTEALVKERIEPLVNAQSLQCSVLGRGLSTGTELEYVDAATMRSALHGRHT